MDWQDANLAGVEDQLHQLRHEGIGESEGLQVGVHQRREQHRQKVPKHSGFGYLFQAFQPDDSKRGEGKKNIKVMESKQKNMTRNGEIWRGKTKALLF